MRLDVTLNCGTVITKEYTIPEILDTYNADFVLSLLLDCLAVWAPMFGLTTFVDGVYSIQIRISPVGGGYTQIANCTFVDITYKCRLATLLEDVIKSEDPGTTAHILHYALVNGSNCGCNCDELCDIFAALSETLSSYNVIPRNECGC
jgi:hypothetical protein